MQPIDEEGATVIEGVENDVSPIDVTPEQQPDRTTESSIEATTLPVLEIGQCISNDVVYENGSAVEPSSPCDESCLCEDGIVRCETQACPPSPPAFLRCSPIEHDRQCCPTYDCRKNSSDSNYPKSWIHMC